MRDSGQVAQDLEGSEDEELRKAVEVSLARSVSDLGVLRSSHQGDNVSHVCPLATDSEGCSFFAAGQLEDAVKVADT